MEKWKSVCVCFYKEKQQQHLKMLRATLIVKIREGFFHLLYVHRLM